MAAVSTVAKPTAADDVAAPRGRACKTCGSPVEAGDKFCTACGATQPAAPAVPVPAAQKRFRCQNCSAEVSVDPNQRSFICPFCGSTYVVEMASGDDARQPPEFVIGFAVTPEQAAEKFRAWLRSGGWFRPGDLALARVHDQLRGVYLPFWSFSMLARSQWSAQIGEHWYRTETYTTTENGHTVTHTRQVEETEWWNLSGKHHNYYSGFLVSGSKGLPQKDAERIKPFQIPAMKRYEPRYLAGWFSEEYSVPKDAALELCRQEFSGWEQQSVARFLPGDTHRAVSVQTEFSDVNSDLLLLPVYLLSYSYGDRLYRFLINGQTGKVDGDMPLSSRRIALAVVGGVLAAALVMLWFRLMRH